MSGEHKAEQDDGEQTSTNFVTEFGRTVSAQPTTPTWAGRWWTACCVQGRPTGTAARGTAGAPSTV